jgi:flap endonuclease-1
MGVKELNPYLRENVSAAIEEVSLEQFSGKRAAIDASIYLYKFLYKNPRFLEGFFQQIFRLKTNGITPIYIFDGAPPPEKLMI